MKNILNKIDTIGASILRSFFEPQQANISKLELGCVYIILILGILGHIMWCYPFLLISFLSTLIRKPFK